MMRTSNYTNYISIEEAFTFFLVHGYTGAVDKAPPEVVRFLLDHRDLAHPGSHTTDERAAVEALKDKKYETPSEDVIEMLRARGYLTEKTVEEERTYVQKLANLFHGRSVRDAIPGFLLIPTYECNLRCPYCFETSTRVDLSRHGTLRDVMTPGRVDDAFATMDILMRERCPKSVDVGALWKSRGVALYGGEPLQQMTRSIVEYILEKSRERGAKVSAISNAVDLHLFEPLLSPQDIR